MAGQTIGVKHPLVQKVWEKQQQVWDKWAEFILEVLRQHKLKPHGKDVNIRPSSKRFRNKLVLITRFINYQERLVKIYYRDKLIWKGCV